jgi:hypothetical protein
VEVQATPTTYLRLKTRQKEDQTNLAAKHKLCYWMSNKPRITSCFSKLQLTLKITDKQRITARDIYEIYACLYAYLCVCVFIPSAGHTGVGSFPNYIHMKVFVKTTCKSFPIKQQEGGLAYLMPDCGLEVTLNPEGPATGQLTQGFPWFFLVQEQMLSWYPNSTLYCMLHMQPSQW